MWTEAWDELGPYLLHDAVTAASYRHGDEGVASISRADRRGRTARGGGPVPGLHRRRGVRLHARTASRCRCCRSAAAFRRSWRGPTSNAPPMAAERAVTKVRNHRGKTDRVGCLVDGWRRIDRHRRHSPASGPRPRRRLGALEDKVGRDAGELAGGEPIGVTATNDADALIAAAAGLRRLCRQRSGTRRRCGARLPALA